MAISEHCAGTYHALLGPYWVRAGTFLNSFPAEGRGTPAESERADAAATPAQADETLHVHSVASQCSQALT